MGIPLSTFWQRLYDKMRLGGGISTSGGATFILEFVGMHDISDSKLEGLRKDPFDLIDYHSRDGVCPAGPFYFEEIGFDHSSVVDCSDPLANRTFILPEDLIGRRVCTFMPADVSPLKEWAAKHGESIEVSPISCDLVAIMSTCKEGMPVIVESEASLPLEAVMELPLNFDFGMRRGLVCREEDAVSLAPIFALAHEVMSGTENEHRAKVQSCQDATRCSH